METIGKLLSDFWKLLVSGFEGLCLLLVEFGNWVLDSTLNLLFDFATWVKEDVFLPVLESITSNPFGNWVVMQSDYLAYVNYFLPVSEMISLIVILLWVWTQILMLKIALKLIPTIY